jgi:hypothetical protein
MPKVYIHLNADVADISAYLYFSCVGVHQMKFLVIRKRSLFPKCIRHFREVKGICVGRCIDKKDDIESNLEAHAHCLPLCKPYQGWICLRRKNDLKEKYLLLHEVAHLIANTVAGTPSHGKKWRKVVVAIGGTYKPFLSFDKKHIYNDFSPKVRK